MILLIAAGCSNKKYDEAMEKGEEAINNEDYEEAVMFFEKAVDEREDDKKAKSYLKQSDKMVSGLSSFKDGDFNHAKEDFYVILNEDEEEAILHKQAEEEINEIEEIEDTYEEVTKSYEDAKEYLNDEEYKKALTLIDQFLNKNLSHAYLSKSKENLRELKETVQDEQTKMQDLRNEAKETYDEAENLGNDENYDKALSIIGDILEVDLNHPKLTAIKEDLESLQGELKEKEKQAEDERVKSQLFGYWFNPEHEIEVCNFEENHFICLIAASDTVDFGYVESYEVDAVTGIITINIEDGAPLQVSIDGNILNQNSIQYKKGSKEEVYGKIDNFVDNPSDLFEMKFYEDWEDF